MRDEAKRASKVKRSAARGRVAAGHWVLTIALVAGAGLGSVGTVLSARLDGDASLAGWPLMMPAKDDARLAASADLPDGTATGTGCTELARDRRTGLTVAVACGAIAPARGPLRPGEIES